MKNKIFKHTISVVMGCCDIAGKGSCNAELREAGSMYQLILTVRGDKVRINYLTLFTLFTRKVRGARQEDSVIKAFLCLNFISELIQLILDMRDKVTRHQPSPGVNDCVLPRHHHSAVSADESEGRSCGNTEQQPANYDHSRERLAADIHPASTNTEERVLIHDYADRGDDDMIKRAILR